VVENKILQVVLGVVVAQEQQVLAPVQPERLDRVITVEMVRSILKVVAVAVVAQWGKMLLPHLLVLLAMGVTVQRPQ
jgi:hypothetical protein